MIKNYGDHAANERTYLAWVRTGLAIVALGLLIERLDLLLARSSLADSLGVIPSFVSRLSGDVARYDGLALIIGGVLLIALATVRFSRTAHQLDDPRPRSASGARLESALSATLLLMICGYALYLAW
jgi:putative membrane protein